MSGFISVFHSLFWLTRQLASNDWREQYRFHPGGRVDSEAVVHAGTTHTVTVLKDTLDRHAMAVVDWPSGEGWQFQVRTESRLKLGADIEINDAEFDDAFVLTADSMALAKRICEQEALRNHLIKLPARLADGWAKLSRITADGGTLAVEINVHRTPDPYAIYRNVFDWLAELDRLLSADPTERPLTPQDIKARLRKARAARAKAAAAAPRPRGGKDHGS
jgi:hypothetical protein